MLANKALTPFSKIGEGVAKAAVSVAEYQKRKNKEFQDRIDKYGRVAIGS